MHEELKLIFGNAVVVGTKSIPAAHLRYRGKSKSFVVWTIISNNPEVSGDDEEIYSVYQVDVDVYSDGDYTEILSAVKTLMKNNGYVWYEDSPEMYEEDTGLYHITATFEKGRYLCQQ